MAPKKKGFTVFGVHEGNVDHREQVYCKQALTGEDAEVEALRLYPTLIIAGYAPGPPPVNLAPITPIRGAGFETPLAEIRATYKLSKLPTNCPGCKSDLRKANALYQWNIAPTVWLGRLPRTTKSTIPGVAVSDDLGARDPLNGNVPRIAAIRLQCTKCNLLLWDGVK
jgi:hypothetical protein